MTKMGQKLIKIAQKSRCFCTFFVFVLLKLITSWKSRGARAPVPHSWRRQWSDRKRRRSFISERPCL